MTAKEYMKVVAADTAYSYENIDTDAMEKMCDEIMAAKRIFITGAGRSLLVMRAFAMTLMQIGFDTRVVGDVTTPAARPGDLLIAGSFSGTTKTTRMHLECARKFGLRFALWTAHKSSPMADEADVAVVVPCPTGEGRETVQWGGYDYEHALFPLCDILVWMLCDRLGIDEAGKNANHANIE